MFCKYCGYSLDEDAIFCPNCGKKLDISKSEIKQAISQESKNSSLIDANDSLSDDYMQNSGPVISRYEPINKKKNSGYIITIILVFVILAALICALYTFKDNMVMNEISSVESDSENNRKDTEMNIDIETSTDEAVSIEEDASIDEKRSANKEASKPAVREIITPKTKVYEDSRVIIYLTGINSKGVMFDVENLTDVNITIQASSIAINGISTNNISMSDDVAPLSIGSVVARCGFDPNTEIGLVSGQLRVIDFNRSFESYDAIFDSVVVDGSIDVTPEPVGTLVYEDDKVKIYYKDITARGVVFDVDNLTDVNITVQADSVSVNKRSVNNITMSDSVAPHSIGEICAKCSPEFEGEVSTIGGQLRIIDFNKSFESYDAVFTNISVE